MIIKLISKLLIHFKKMEQVLKIKKNNDDLIYTLENKE